MWSVRPYINTIPKLSGRMKALSIATNTKNRLNCIKYGLAGELLALKSWANITTRRWKRSTSMRLKPNGHHDHRNAIPKKMRAPRRTKDKNRIQTRTSTPSTTSRTRSTPNDWKIVRRTIRLARSKTHRRKSNPTFRKAPTSTLSWTNGTKKASRTAWRCSRITRGGWTQAMRRLRSWRRCIRAWKRRSRPWRPSRRGCIRLYSKKKTNFGPKEGKKTQYLKKNSFYLVIYRCPTTRPSTI